MVNDKWLMNLNLNLLLFLILNLLLNLLLNLNLLLFLNLNLILFPALCGALSGATRTLVHLVFKNLRGCINALDVMIFKLSEGIALYIA